jgi:flagellar protein FlaG
LLIIASILIVTAVAGAIVGQFQSVTSALEESGETASDELQSDLEIVDDPGAATSIYDDRTDELTVHVENTGSRALPADPEAIDLLVDGEYHTDVDVTLLDDSRWQPGSTVRLTTGLDLDENATLRVIVRVDGAEDTLVFDAVGSPELPREAVVYTTPTGWLESVSPDGTVTNYSVTAAAIGPEAIDFDGDDRLEVPFVHANGTLGTVDRSGEAEHLATGAETNATLLAVGTWRHGTSVFYVNESDGGYLYRVGPDSGPERVFADGSPIEASAIGGLADYNDDGDLDLVYADPSANVTYVDGKTAHDVGRTVGTGPGVGIGAPREFDGSAPPRAPFVDAGGDVALLSAGNGKTALTGSGPAASAPVAGLDWTGNGDREVVFVDASSGTLYYVRLDGTVVEITDDGGDPIAADPETGAA